jgi:hypothetical protein
MPALRAQRRESLASTRKRHKRDISVFGWQAKAAKCRLPETQCFLYICPACCRGWTGVEFATCAGTFPKGDYDAGNRRET